MADILISKFTTQIPRVGATPATPGFAESEGQDPVAPSGTPQVYTPVTIGSPANGLSISGTQVLTIGLASTSTTGALSSTDWNTFNNKLNLTSPITGYTVGANTALADTDTILQAFGKVQGQINARISGTIASGQVAFGTGVNTVVGVSGFTFNSTTGTLAITNSTGAPIQFIKSGFDTYSFFQSAGTGLEIRNTTDGRVELFFDGTGRVGINTTSLTNTLDVNGTTRIRTISNLGSAATSVLVPSATGVISLRTLAELSADMGAITLVTGDARYLRKDVADTQTGGITFVNTIATNGSTRSANGDRLRHSSTNDSVAGLIIQNGFSVDQLVLYGIRADLRTVDFRVGSPVNPLPAAGSSFRGGQSGTQIIFQVENSSNQNVFQVEGRGGILSPQSRSTGNTALTRRDELYLNYSETVATAGTINNLAINAGTKLLILTGADDLTGVVPVDNTRLLRIEARGANRIIRDQSASSTAANRFALGADLTINAGEVYQFIYTDSRWRRVL